MARLGRYMLQPPVIQRGVLEVPADAPVDPPRRAPVMVVTSQALPRQRLPLDPAIIVIAPAEVAAPSGAGTLTGAVTASAVVSASATNPPAPAAVLVSPGPAVHQVARAARGPRDNVTTLWTQAEEGTTPVPSVVGIVTAAASITATSSQPAPPRPLVVQDLTRPVLARGRADTPFILSSPPGEVLAGATSGDVAAAVTAAGVVSASSDAPGTAVAPARPYVVQGRGRTPGARAAGEQAAVIAVPMVVAAPVITSWDVTGAVTVVGVVAASSDAAAAVTLPAVPLVVSFPRSDRAYRSRPETAQIIAPMTDEGAAAGRVTGAVTAAGVVSASAATTVVGSVAGPVTAAAVVSATVVSPGVSVQGLATASAVITASRADTATLTRTVTASAVIAGSAFTPSTVGSVTGQVTAAAFVTAGHVDPVVTDITLRAVFDLPGHPGQGMQILRVAVTAGASAWVWVKATELGGANLGAVPLQVAIVRIGSRPGPGAWLAPDTRDGSGSTARLGLLVSAQLIPVRGHWQMWVRSPGAQDPSPVPARGLIHTY